MLAASPSLMPPPPESLHWPSALDFLPSLWYTLTLPRVQSSALPLLLSLSFPLAPLLLILIETTLFFAWSKRDTSLTKRPSPALSPLTHDMAKGTPDSNSATRTRKAPF